MTERTKLVAVCTFFWGLGLLGLLGTIAFVFGLLLGTPKEFGNFPPGTVAGCRMAWMLICDYSWLVAVSAVTIAIVALLWSND
jgi:membrane-bound ClpP family serine protease